ncbi:MAG: cytochrome c peroxidase [Acidobacteriota bacterium]
MRNRRSLPTKILILAGLWTLTGCNRGEPAATTGVRIPDSQLSIFAPLPEVVESPEYELTSEKIDLGRMLYYDTRLSADRDISCNSCHDLLKYGVDSQPVSDGHRKQLGDRNAPSVYNAAGHFVQFWDGRAPHVEEQAKGPVMNPVEMAMASEEDLVAALSADPGYQAAFHAAFPDNPNPITLDNVGLAIGAFERKLLTPGRWDRFLKGDGSALTPAEKAGFSKFMEVGCQGCHNGPYLGGDLYQKMGARKPWTDTTDLGRFRVTHRDSDKMLFKVPSLRNVEMTAPYYHNGSVATLDEAVREMGEYQLGRILTPEETDSIVVWLHSLTGEIPVDYVTLPLQTIE